MFALLFIMGLALVLTRPRLAENSQVTYTQITHFTDSAVSPALSPDGKMIVYASNRLDPDNLDSVCARGVASDPPCESAPADTGCAIRFEGGRP